MSSFSVAAIFIVLMVVVIVSMDILFFRNLPWERLMVNIAIVLLFVAFYLKLTKHS